MPKNFRLLTGLLVFLIVFTKSYATDSTALDPTKNLLTDPAQKVANLAYVTFAAPAGSSQLMGLCPAGLVLVSGSGTHVPPIPGLWDTEQFYWQCVQSINGWSTAQNNGEIQPYSGMNYSSAYNNNLVDNSQNGAPVWTSDPNFDPQHVAYTYFNFPGNQFIPTGVGGSGIVCPAASGRVQISCTNGLGQTVLNQTYYNLDKPTVFYIGPGDTAKCQVTRTYDRDPSATCSGEVSIPSGQAKVMACCQRNWYCKTGSWQDPGLTTCDQCPCGGNGQPACGPGNCN